MKKAAFANNFAPRDGILRLHCLPHEDEFSRADSFLLELDGMLWLIDGGMKGSRTTLEHLAALRESYLAASGLSGGDAPPLLLDWVVSHFHIDHVGAMISELLPAEFISLGNLYLPPRSAYISPPGNQGSGHNGGEKLRSRVVAALEKYGSGGERIVNTDFGAGNVLGFTDPTGRLKFTLYPTPFDGGVGERLEYMINGYYGGDATHKNVPVAAVNSNCLWLRAAYGETRFLFTGDLMKREPGLDNEALDEMMRAYASDIGRIDVIKYPHHGCLRDAAARHMLSFRPRHIVMTSKEETASAALRACGGGETVEIHNCSDKNILFSTDGKNLNVSDYPGRAG